MMKPNVSVPVSSPKCTTKILNIIAAGRINANEVSVRTRRWAEISHSEGTYNSRNLIQLTESQPWKFAFSISKTPAMQDTGK